MNFFAISLGLYFAFVSAYLSIVLSRLLKQNGNAIREQGEKLSTLTKGAGRKDGFSYKGNRRTNKDRTSRVQRNDKEFAFEVMTKKGCGIA